MFKSAILAKSVQLAKPIDFSEGFADFFDSIGLTGVGLVTKAIAAVIAVISLRMLGKTINNPKEGLRHGAVGLGTLFVAVILAMYGADLFSTVTNAEQ